MHIAFVVVPSSGHVYPTLAVSAELIRRGHRVTYFLNEAYRDKVAATGADYRDTPNLFATEMEPPGGKFNPPLLAKTLLDMSERILPDLVAALAADPPDVVVYDSMCPWGRLAAHMIGVPAVASMALINFPGAMLFRSGEALRIVGVLARGLPDVIGFMRTARRLQRTVGLKLPPLTDILNWPGDFNISYTSARFQPDATKLGSTYRFVGPTIMQRPHDPDFPWDKLDPDRPLIYVSLGTVFNDNTPFYHLCLEALRDGAYQVVLSFGKRTDPEALGLIPPHVIVRPHVPQLALLERADLFITHAGMNSINEGLYFNVPLLLVPQQLEQALVAQRVVELGAGRLVRNGRVSAESLRQTIDQMLQDATLAANVQRVGTSLRAAGGARAAVDAIETLVGIN
ncbi:MAG: oleandomycin glycosyltransferase [Anaerolineae bacterium]|nr:oleandomycin glycosyltransferase [Anaerolineae bacterium]